MSIYRVIGRILYVVQRKFFFNDFRLLETWIIITYLNAVLFQNLKVDYVMWNLCIM
jgi:hypothetical protein